MSEEKFKTTKNDAFGASKLEKLRPGDFVSWDSWAESLESTSFEEKNGLLVSIFKEERLHGQGFMAKIIPFGVEKEVILPLICLRKMERKD